MPSHLSSKVTHLFPSSVKSRGRTYYEAGAVRIKTGSASALTAVVRGSSAYKVEIVWDWDGITLYCSCPYFDSSGPCKHLWAAVLAADEHHHLSDVKEPPRGAGGFHVSDIIAELGDALSNFGARRPAPRVSSAPPRLVVQPPAWKARIAGIQVDRSPYAPREWPANRRIFYMVERDASLATGHLVLALCARDIKQNGELGRLQTLSVQRGQIPFLPVRQDREILSAIAGGVQHHPYTPYSDDTYSSIPSSHVIRYPLSGIVLPLIARTGRCYLRKGAAEEDWEPLVWDEAGEWRFELQMRRQLPDKDASKDPGWLVDGILCRDAPPDSATALPGTPETLAVSAPTLLTQGGHVFHRGTVASLAEATPFEWMMQFRRNGPIPVPAKDCGELISTLLATPGLPKLELPEELRFDEVMLTPRPCLGIHASQRHHANARLAADLNFDYEGRTFSPFSKEPGFFDAAGRRFVRRDPEAEHAALNLLRAVGFKATATSYYRPVQGWELTPAKLPGAVRPLLEAGWHVEADGKEFRRPGTFRMEVSSGVDWFELHAAVDYGDTSARLPALLQALQRGENMVKLGDGTWGFLPEEWLQRIRPFAAMGTPGTAAGAGASGHIRFRHSQAGLLDALLATQPEATFDAGFARMRERMRDFRSIEIIAQPKGFVGQLRDYQREGLGWMEFLRRFSFGGCLADDMGVGKTAQVLALLESRRELQRGARNSRKPSLVVVPRSLLFNWREEAARFTPQLRVLDYTGLNRDANDFSSYHLVLTTYGTLRRDAAKLKDVVFDYVVLDEAQAVKNSGTEAAKAVRLLQSEHRLALSGTPVENHLGELWSLFEFLNPGMLGAASVFKLTSGRDIDEETRKLLSQALRPFILRRTKDQVARELPAKTEQTIYCELKPDQRKLYDELRQHYRDALLSRIETQGLAKSKIMVLEALLRLRQAACHPGLIDAKRSGDASAKLDALLEHLREVLDAGHKALVFSQFTSLLKIVRNRLDAEGVVYEYLDGKTRDRQACVERFQNEAGCKLFLISLKAGGLGLNLTAAEYVFLLDPWWNPAVEAQAVDRAHRIGQTRSVFAYRLIARDTVEEKVLELQKTKRDLANAIIGEDNALIRNLKREDLELLLS